LGLILLGAAVLFGLVWRAEISTRGIAAFEARDRARAGSQSK